MGPDGEGNSWVFTNRVSKKTKKRTAFHCLQCAGDGERAPEPLRMPIFKQKQQKASVPSRNQGEGWTVTCESKTNEGKIEEREGNVKGKGFGEKETSEASGMLKRSRRLLNSGGGGRINNMSHW